MSPKQRYRKSCKSCRQRHLKCDQTKPKCTNCQRSKHEIRCVYELKQFRFQRYMAPPAITGRDDVRADNDTGRDCPTPAASHISNSTQRGEESDGDDDIDTTVQVLATQPPACQPPHSPPDLAGCSPGILLGGEQGDADRTEVDSFAPPHVSQDSSPVVQTSLSSQGVLNEAAISDFNNVYHLSQVSPATVSVVASQHNPMTSLSMGPSGINNDMEAHIMSYYLDTAGPWLDIVSPNRFFGIHVPQLIMKEPVLLSACLAYSSLVLHLHGQITAEIKDELHERALRQLIPYVTSYHQGRGTVHDLGPIHATTVILRMAEQFLELDEDRQHHLHGSSTLFETAHYDWSLLDDTLSSTSFWAYLRGSIRVSFLLERPCPFELKHLGVWRYASKDAMLTDEARSNLMTYLLAEVCTFCWGDVAADQSSASKLSEVRQAITQWEQFLPPSFRPWYLRYGDDDVFPDVRFLAPWHCVAWQFFYAAEVMLAVYSSTLHTEKNVFRLTRLLEEKVATPTRWLCGVTLSSTHAGVKINGSHLVAWCAQYITGKTEQDKISKMLLSLWGDEKWPNLTCHNRLKDLWSGARESWTD